MIYFARIGDSDRIKIGTTIALRQRMGGLKSLYGEPLTVLAVRDGGRKEEREHHQRFAHLRVKRTEEFRAGPDLLAYIEAECRTPDLLDTLREDGKPKAEPPVRLPADFVKLARIVVAFEGTSLTDYLSGLLRPAVEADYDRVIKEAPRRKEPKSRK